MASDSRLRYEYRRPNVPLLLRLRNRYAGLRDRRGVYRQFLIDNNIDPTHIDTHAITRVRYMVRTHHTEYLAHVRDRALQQEAARARRVRGILRAEIIACEETLDTNEAKLDQLKKDRDSVKQSLKSASLTHLQIAHRQGDLGTLDASIKNQKEDVAANKRDLALFKEQFKDNYKKFREYRRDIRSTYDIALNDYVKLAGRRLNKIGFTIYDAEMRDFSDETIAQIKELIDGE